MMICAVAADQSPNPVGSFTKAETAITNWLFRKLDVRTDVVSVGKTLK